MNRTITSLALSFLVAGSLTLTSCANDTDDGNTNNDVDSTEAMVQPEETAPAPATDVNTTAAPVTNTNPAPAAKPAAPTTTVQSQPADTRNDVQKAAAKVREGAKEVQETTNDVKQTAKEVDKTINDVKGVFGKD